MHDPYVPRVQRAPSRWLVFRSGSRAARLRTRLAELRAHRAGMIDGRGDVDIASHAAMERDAEIAHVAALLARRGGDDAHDQQTRAILAALVLAMLTLIPAALVMAPALYSGFGHGQSRAAAPCQEVRTPKS